MGAHEEKEADWTLNSGLVAMIVFGDGLGAMSMIPAANFLGEANRIYIGMTDTHTILVNLLFKTQYDYV